MNRFIGIVLIFGVLFTMSSQNIFAAEKVFSVKADASTEGAVDPQDLGNTGSFAGDAPIAGDREPFWETWWFWTVVGSAAATAGGLTYYFTQVNQPPSKQNVNFQLRH